MLATKNLDSSSPLISVSLKSLIDLAKAAGTLNLKHFSIRSGQSGGYVSRFKGRGMEFDEVRFYQPGDDIRSIDWRVTARTGKTHTKLFREERERPVFISVDNRLAMHFATRGVFKSVLAAKLAALLAWTAHHHSDRIGGQLFSETECIELKPQNGKQAVLRFLNALVIGNNASHEGVRITLEQVLARLVQHARPGSLVYIVSDFRGINNAAEIHLARLAKHCELVLVFLYDPLETQLPSKGQYRFTNDEREVVFDTSDKDRLLKYQQHFTERLEALEKITKKLGQTFIKCATTEDAVQCLR